MPKPDHPAPEGKTMAEVFVVVGTTGEYESCREWLVAAYAARSLAESHASLANEALAESSGWDFEARHSFSTPYDPQIQIDYTGTSYFVTGVELRDALPEPQA